MLDLVKKFARILFALPLLWFGYNHFAMAGAMTGMVWLPGGIFWVYLTGVAMILAAVAFLFDKYMDYAAFGLAAFLFLTTFTIHLPGLLGGGQATGFLKDFMLMAAALYFAAQKSEGEPEPAHAH